MFFFVLFVQAKSVKRQYAQNAFRVSLRLIAIDDIKTIVSEEDKRRFPPSGQLISFGNRPGTRASQQAAAHMYSRMAPVL